MRMTQWQRNRGRKAGITYYEAVPMPDPNPIFGPCVEPMCKLTTTYPDGSQLIQMVTARSLGQHNPYAASGRGEAG